MSSRIVDIAKVVKSYLLLENRTPTYTERGNYYRQRAILESMKNGVNVDTEKGVDLIDIAETTALTLPTGNQIEFARNSDGIYFARIEGSKYFPIDTKPSEDLLKEARRFERASRSYFRRLLKEYDELMHFGSILYTLDKIIYRVDDSNFRLGQLNEVLERMVRVQTETVRKQTGVLEQTVRKLGDGIDKPEKNDSNPNF